VNDQKEGHGMTSYKAISSNEPLAVRVFQVTDGEPSRRGWYTRLWVDYPDYDLLITFGPMSRTQAQTMEDLLQRLSCEVRENWEGPFERDKEAVRVQAQKANASES
jgi:hypothetical protein